VGIRVTGWQDTPGLASPEMAQKSCPINAGAWLAIIGVDWAGTASGDKPKRINAPPVARANPSELVPA